MRYSTVVVTMFAGALLVGCSNDSMMSPRRPMTLGFAMSPADGATGVRLDAAVTLTFTARVDQAVVARNLHLISERAIADSMCPDSATMSHPDMTHCMADSAMMRHLDEAHATPGSFSWNTDGTVCTFRPDAMLSPMTRHMIHMGREMMDMLGNPAEGGMMGGHGAGMMSGHMMLHFTTMDTTSGHDGHHGSALDRAHE